MLTSSVTTARYLIQEWEGWKDKIVIEHRNEGDTWKPSASSTVAVEARWLDHLRFPLQDRIERQSRPRTPPPMDRSEKVSNIWRKAELLLMITLRDAGKSWEVVSKPLNSRTASSVRDLYYHKMKRQISVWDLTRLEIQL